jgi:CheY-like chemotaxis protein
MAFDLLFTDVIMPGGMNGCELSDHVARRRPGTMVLYTSGYTDNAIIHRSHLDGEVLLLAKPYRMSQLACVVRMALGMQARRGSRRPISSNRGDGTGLQPPAELDKLATRGLRCFRNEIFFAAPPAMHVYVQNNGSVSVQSPPGDSPGSRLRRTGQKVFPEFTSCGVTLWLMTATPIS